MNRNLMVIVYLLIFSFSWLLVYVLDKKCDIITLGNNGHSLPIIVCLCLCGIVPFGSLYKLYCLTNSKLRD